MSVKDYKKVCESILNTCDKLTYAPNINELPEYGIKVEIKLLNNYLKNNTMFKDYKDFCRKNSYKFINDFKINDSYKNAKELSLDDYIYLIKQFKEKNGHFPSMNEYKSQYNLPSFSSFNRFLNKNKLKVTEFNQLIGSPNINPNDFSYEYWLNIFIEKSNEIGEPLKQSEVTSYGLPNSRWLIQNCKNPKVTNYNEFIEYEAKMQPRFDLSKEKVSELIIDIQNKLDHPIMKKDLKLYGICESVVKKFWGSLNEMKNALGLEIKYKSRKKNEININSVKRDITRVCSYVYETEGRTVICQNDWNALENVVSYSTCSRYLKNNGSSIREFIGYIGFEYVQAGNGINYSFDDGEFVKSKYEMDFSRYLREDLKLLYNEDYKRDVRYKTFIKDYNGLLDCDYVIQYKGKTIYIEIAGMLRDYKNTYQIKQINSKSREKYRLKLLEKEHMLSSDNLYHFILFPNDIEKSKLENLFNNII